MSLKHTTVLLSAVAMLSSAVHSAAQPFERYQTIIDRKPFGPEPVNFDPESAPGSSASSGSADAMTEEQRTAEEQQVAASVRVSMINVTPSGAVAVGFTDSSANPPENYYLIVGRTQNGWTVKSADPATETVTLVKGGVEVTVKLGESVGGGNGKKGEPKNRRPALPMMLRERGGAPVASQQTAEPSTDASAPDGGRLGGLARLRQRRAEMRAKAQEEAARKAEADAVAAAERAERDVREAEEKRQRAEREAQEAEERAQQREALRQIQEQLRKEREAREAAERRTEGVQEEVE